MRLPRGQFGIVHQQRQLAGLAVDANDIAIGTFASSPPSYASGVTWMADGTLLMRQRVAHR
ncbi:Uncharacterised protein [Raoultella terrigena]|uniref:Uncharacterized protein n=1 Tax=Raoultella terrigena TaxID=577 RepID=A0A3P8M021_RAOTE|nr:Uncharacterised protein [Raoultella terrigena]